MLLIAKVAGQVALLCFALSVDFTFSQFRVHSFSAGVTIITCIRQSIKCREMLFIECIRSHIFWYAQML